MNILALDTCFDACSVAVRVGEKGDFEVRELMRRGHAEALLPMVERVMRDAELQFDQLDRIAITAGPGTFTGSRVGVAAALGLSLAHDIGVVTYSSLYCIARAGLEFAGAAADDFDGLVVLRDAKRGSVYLEIVDTAGQTTEPPALLAVDEAKALLAERRLLGLGSGVDLCAAQSGVVELSQALNRALPDGLDEPSARFMLSDADAKELNPRPVPLYLRPPDATPSSKPPLARAV